jgi:D-glycero-D-manno-heptose 1,7-bisphosphate phosphatase
MTPREPVSTGPPSRIAVFVDRDGVINKERRDYVTHWGEFRFLPGAIDALVALTRAGLEVFIITNQSAIHRGLVSPDDVRRLHQHMVASIQQAGGHVRGVYVCPHTPDEACACRKPQPGLLLRAAAEHRLDLTRCYLIGDKVSDMEAGRAVGCRCIMVLTGLDAPPTGTVPSAAVGAAYRVCPGIREAVALVLQDEAANRSEPSTDLVRADPVTD